MEEFLKKYKIEAVLIIISLFIAAVSLFMFTNITQEDIDSEILFEEPVSGKIFVDISGAVNKPGVYELRNGSRLKDAVTMAKGLTDEAGKDFFARNYNLAKILTDQEKIYIPFAWELEQGIFFENSRALNYTQPQVLPAEEAQNQPRGLININTATAEELDTLSGIGKVTAEKIIKNRPYQSIDELLTKKVIGKNVFENIKGSLTTQ